MCRSIRIVLALVWIVVTGFLVNSPAGPHQNGQKKERTIKKAPWRGDPIKIEKIRVKGNPISEEKFLEDDDWLRTLSIGVKNTSGRIIKYIELDLIFPRPQDSPNQIVSRDHLIYGQYPMLPGDVEPVNPQPPILPDDSIEIPLADYAGTMDFLLSTNYGTSITKLEIEIGMVIFDDNTKWSDGQLFRRDPTKRDRWIPLLRPKNKARNEINLVKFTATSYRDSRQRTYFSFPKISFRFLSTVFQDGAKGRMVSLRLLNTTRGSKEATATA